MREIGRQRRLRRSATIGLAAMVAIAVGGSLAATQAKAASTTPAAPKLSLSRQFFGTTVEPYTGKNTAVFRYTLRNNRGMNVQILTYGATVQDIWVPGRNGRAADVVLGFKTLADYVKFNSPPVAPTTGVYFGETVGRYANRIAKGKFSLNQPGQGKVNVHPARQQRAERPARRDRRLRQPHLGRQAGLRSRLRGRPAHAGQPER